MASAAPPSVTASAPTPASIPPIPSERMAPRAPVASTPPPPYTPPPAAPVARPATVASAPPSLPPTPPPSAPSRAPAVVPPPSAAPAALAAASATQVASAGTLSRVLFAAGSADLNDDGRQALTQLAARLGRDADSRIQLLAYADGNAENESQARRLSLSRALAVRAYLIDQGVRSTRVNVQALGIKSAGGPPDRVDAMAATP